MMNRSFVDKHANKWNRVSKKAAQKAFDAGKRVMIIPCKLDPASPWACYAYASNKFGDTFDGIASFYASCNCSNEAGRYLAYYVTDGPVITIRAPRFSCGGSGYATADTIEVTINGYRLKNNEFYVELSQLVDTLNTGGRSREDVHRVLDPVAASLVGRVAW